MDLKERLRRAIERVDFGEATASDCARQVHAIPPPELTTLQLCNLPFGIRHFPSAIWHPAFPLCPLPFVIRRLPPTPNLPSPIFLCREKEITQRAANQQYTAFAPPSLSAIEAYEPSSRRIPLLRNVFLRALPTARALCPPPEFCYAFNHIAARPHEMPEEPAVLMSAPVLLGHPSNLRKSEMSKNRPQEGRRCEPDVYSMRPYRIFKCHETPKLRIPALPHPSILCGVGALRGENS
jgi:hypothetical protein